MTHQCQYDGNPDLYGLGIRLGFYLQWLSGPITDISRTRSESDDIQKANLLFSTTLLLAIFVVTFGEMAHLMDVVIMLYLFFGGLMSISDQGIFKYMRGYLLSLRSREQNFTSDGRHFVHLLVSQVLWAAASSYAVWFWLAAQKSNLFASDHACGPVIFLFTKIPTTEFGAVGKLFAAGSAVQSLSAAMLLVTCGFMEIDRKWLHWLRGKLEKYAKEKSARRTSLSSSMSSSSDVIVLLDQILAPEELPGSASNVRGEFSKNTVAFLNIMRIVFGTLWTSFFIVAIELMLKWNNVTGVNDLRSVGQFIPFITGLVGFINLLYSIGRDLKQRKSVQHSQQKDVEMVDKPSHSVIAQDREVAVTSCTGFQVQDGRWR